MTSRAGKGAVRPLAVEAGGRLYVAYAIEGAHAVTPPGPGLPRPCQCRLLAQAGGEAREGEGAQSERGGWPERLRPPPGPGLPTSLVGAPSAASWALFPSVEAARAMKVSWQMYSWWWPTEQPSHMKARASLKTSFPYGSFSPEFLIPPPFNLGNIC